jgi:hypothetical protein
MRRLQRLQVTIGLQPVLNPRAIAVDDGRSSRISGNPDKIELASRSHGRVIGRLSELLSSRAIAVVAV